MNIFVVGHSALEYWVRRSLADSWGMDLEAPIRQRLDTWGLSLSRVHAAPRSVPSSSDVERVRKDALWGIDKPVELLVDSASNRQKSKDRVCRVQGSAIPAASFVRVEKGVYVATPEYAFCQILHGAAYAASMLLAYELCASYVRSREDARGFRPCPPLSSPQLLGAYLSQGDRGTRGMERLRSVVSHVAGGSASPMESLLAVSLCTPRLRGGFGFDLPELNGVVAAGRNVEAVSDASFYRCDLLWREGRVAVEYDSDMFHTGADRIAHDARRRNALTAQGYTVITVTKRQFYDELELIGVAAQIARALKARLRFDRGSYDWKARYATFRRDLLGAPGLRLNL